MTILDLYLLVVCAFTAIIAISDKSRARYRIYRVPEMTLLFLALIGGAVGLWLGLSISRHKTKKIIFSVGVPLLALIQAAIYIWLKNNFIV